MPKRWTSEEALSMVRAFQPACVLVAAAELDIFTALQKRPMTAKSLAGRLRCEPRAMAILLDALTAIGFLTKHGDKYSVHTKTSEIFSQAGLLQAVRHLGNCLRRWAQLAEVVQTGKPVKRLASIHGPCADMAAFIGAMDNFSAGIADEIIGKLRPLNFRRLLDIGGASGTWTAAFLRAVPRAKATLFDLPEVIPLARRYIANAGFSDRVSLVAGDYYTDNLPCGADFVWLSAIAHQNSRPQNRSLFAKIYAALQKTGSLVIRDVVMNKSRTRPAAGALFAVNMLVGSKAGGTYTFNEFREDLLQGGFKKVTLIHKDEAMNFLICAQKLL